MKHTIIQHFFLLTFLIIGCQSEKDTASVLLAEADALMYEYPDSALRLLENISHPEQLQGKEQADYALLMTQACSRCRITATSDSLIRIAVDYYQSSTNHARKAAVLLYLADVYMDMKKNTEAVAPLKQAEEVMGEAEPYIQSLIYSKLGFLNRKSGNYSLAIENYQKGQTINKKHKYQEWYVSNLVNIINLPLSEIQDSLCDYIKELETVLYFAKPDLQAKAYNNIGVYYYKKGQLKQAEIFYQKAIATSKSVPYRSYLNLARIYDKQGNTSRADSLYMQALLSPVWATQAIIYKSLYKRYLSAGRYQEAIDCINRYQIAADSFYTHQKTKDVMEIQLKYEHEKTARQKAETEAQLYLLAMAAFIIISLLLYIGYYFYAYAENRRKEYLQKIQEQIDRIQELEDNKNYLESNIRAEKEKETENLNHLLKQSRILNESFLESKGEWADMTDIRALGLYIRLQKDPKSYNPKIDYESLERWLDITVKGFTEKFTEENPKLNRSEASLCYFRKAGFSYTQIASIFNIKKESINRYIYRVCESLGLPKSKTAFETYIESLMKC